MLRFLQISAVVCVAIAMSLALAHALELPGKMRLNKDAYELVQPIYYPGFTIGAGIGEAGGMLVLLALIAFTPFSTTRFWWTLAAFLFLLAMHLTYWFVTHPVNQFWVKDLELSGLGAIFLSSPLPWKAVRIGQGCVMFGSIPMSRVRFWRCSVWSHFWSL